MTSSSFEPEASTLTSKNADAASALLAELKKLGIHLTVRSENLVVDAPAGALDDQLRERIRAVKPELVRLLSSADFAARAPSFAQERIAYLEMLDPGTPVYNLPVAYDVERGIALKEVVRCLFALCNRHEVLRSRFRMTDDGLHVSVPELCEAEIESCVESIDGKDTVSAVHEFVNRVVPWDGDILFRAALIRNADSTTIVFVFHHIIVDGLSIKQISGEFFELLESSSDGTNDDGAAGYYTFAREQRESQSETKQVAQKSFWSRYLHGIEERLAIISGTESDSGGWGAGSRVRRALPANDAEALREIGAGSHVTLFITLAALYYLALEVLSRQRDIVIGMTIDGRVGTAYEESVGLFVNTLPLRIKRGDERSFRELLGSVRDSFREAFDYQETPFDLIVQSAGVARNPGYTPVYQAMLSFQDKADSSLPSFVRHRACDLDAARIELSLFADYIEDELSLSLEFDRANIDHRVADRVMDLFTIMIGIVCDRPDITLTELRSASLGELGSGDAHCHGRTVESSQQTVLDQFNRIIESERSNGAVAVQATDRALSYSEVADESARLAGHLSARGIGPGDIVGLYLTRTSFLPITILAVWRAGAAYLPLDPEFPLERLKFILKDASVSAVISDAHLDPSQLGCDESLVVDAERDVWMRTEPLSTDLKAAASAAAYVLYTSGSTGLPKGVVVPHGAVANFLSSMRIEPGIQPDDVLLALTTISFDISVLELFLPLISGAKTLIAGTEQAADGRALRKLMETESVSLLQATPSTWRMLIDAGWQGHGEFTVLCGGETFPRDLRKPLLERSAAVWNLYGPTETTVWSACGTVRSEGRITVGKPINNTTIYVVDADGNRLPPGIPGEIWIGGAGVASGYLNRPELTEERFTPASFDGLESETFYRTGDFGRWTDDGELEVFGRFDHQVKVRGFRIELNEIEAQIAQIPDIRQAVVTVWEPAPEDQRLVAYLLATDPSVVSPVALRKQLRCFLPAYMLPQHFVYIEELPLTPNGKVDRKALPSPDGVESASATRLGDSSGEYPQGATEELIAAVWKEVIGIETASRTDNFFDLGGHSLLAIKAIAMMEARLGWRPSPRLLILENLREIALRCDEAAMNGSETEQGLLARLKNLVHASP